MKLYTVIILLVLAVLMSVFMVSFFNETTMFTDFRTAKKEGKTVHVIGRWVNRDKSKFEAHKSFNSFYIEDSTHYIQEVQHYQALAGDLSQADKVDIVGHYKGDIFVAEKVHLKCPSKYKENAPIPQGTPSKNM